MSMREVQAVARNIMTAEPVCAEPCTSLRSLYNLFESHDVSGCPLVDSQGKAVGVVSKADLIRRCSRGAAQTPPASRFGMVCDQGEGTLEGTSEIDGSIPEPLTCVQDFMTRSAVTVRPSTPVREVAALMADRHIHRVVVVDEEQFPLGMISALDVLKVFPRVAP